MPITLRKKSELKQEYCRKKKKLKLERMRVGYSKEYMGAIIGVNRNAYSGKEQGLFPFQDYEMEIISKELKLPIEYLFFID